MSHCWIRPATFPAAGHPLEIQAANDGFKASPAASGPCPPLRLLALAEPDPSAAAVYGNAPCVIRTHDRLLRRLWLQKPKIAAVTHALRPAALGVRRNVRRLGVPGASERGREAL